MKLEQLEVALRSFRISICVYSCTVRHTAYSGDGGLMPPWESPGTSLVAQMVNNQSATQETLGSIPGSGTREKEMATHSSILAGESHGQRSWWATVHGVAKSWT